MFSRRAAIATSGTRARSLGALLSCILLISACSSSGGQAQSAADAATNELVAQTDPTATATASPTPTPEPPEVTAADLYRELSPSIGYVETAEGSSGSGVLIDGGYLLTNHHVAELADTVRVVFPNGTEILEAPVFARDMHSDLALVGPLDTALPQIALVSQEPPEPGERVHLLGYPDESESYPQVTFTQGIVSRYRTMELHEFGFIQVDALIAPGQSGGALMNADGELIGISGLRFGEGEFGLVMDAATVHTTVEKLRTGGDDFSRQSVGFTPDITVRPDQPEVFSFTTDDGVVDLRARSSSDISLELATFSGVPPLIDTGIVDYFRDPPAATEETFVDEVVSGTEDLVFRVEPGTYVVSVASFELEDAEVAIDSAHELFAYVEDDEGLTLVADEVSFGTFGQFVDIDVVFADLTAGVPVRIRIDSISDPVAVLRFDDEVVASGDDDGYGMFGLSVDMTYTPTDSGLHELVVGHYGGDTGGYAILLTEE